MSYTTIKLKQLSDYAFLCSTGSSEDVDAIPPYAWDILKQAPKTEIQLTAGTPKKELPGRGEANWSLQDHTLRISWKDCYFKQHVGPVTTQSKFIIDLAEDEHIYGFGEWFNHFGADKIDLNLFNRESPTILQKKFTYGAFPLFVSNKGILVLVLNANKGKVHLDRKNKKLSIEFNKGPIHYLLVKGKNFKELLDHYTQVTGTPPMVPKWAFGLWHTAFPVEDQVSVIERVKKHKELGIPLDAIILDYHWEQAFHNFKWRREIFPDPDLLIKELKNENVNLGLIYTPYINGPKHSWMSLLFSIFVRYIPRVLNKLKIQHDPEVYKQGLENNYYVHPKVTWWLGKGGAIDFTKKEAVNWWFNFQKGLIDQGVRFFKNDAGEHLPNGAKSSNGLTGTELHNIYPLYYSKALYEQLQQYLGGTKRSLVFARSSWAGTHRYPGIFLGDQQPNFASIRRTMRAGLNLSIGGHAYWGADILGLVGMPTEEEHIRQVQWTMLNPMARYFSCLKIPKRDPWNFSEKAKANFIKYAQLRYQLLPYYYELAGQTYSSGTPIIRPMIYEFPESEKFANCWDQLMIGSGIMICPITNKNKNRSITFPPGDWFDLWTSKHYSGPLTINYSVTEELPIFINGSVLIPKRKTKGFDFDEIELDIYPSAKAFGQIYDDEGDGLDYQQGQFSHQNISAQYDHTTNKGRITFNPTLGNWQSPNTHRLFHLRWMGFHGSIVVNGEILSDQLSSKTIQVSASKHQETTIEYYVRPQ